MIIRSAVLEGTVAQEDRAAFDRQMVDVVLPAIATYPGLTEVRLRRPAEAHAEPGAPEIHMIFDLHFPTLEAMHAALATPVRARVREEIAKAMTAFRGRVYHVVLEEGSVVRGTAA